MEYKKQDTSWEPVQKWYNEAVGKEGHYYHQHIVLPGVLRLMDLKPSDTLLDVACGQGVLARQVPENMSYVGLDKSQSLIKSARQTDRNSTHEYVVADAMQPFPLKKKDFTHAAILLALQNMEKPCQVFNNISKHLVSNGKLVLVINHPCFRIPRQSSWQVDAEKKIQYRRIDRYYSAMKIPIQAHPSKGAESEATWTFHYPLSSFVSWLNETGFSIEGMEEWCSNKTSTGSAAKMENRSRSEIPLFLALVAKKR